jgi:hypothetical protein
VQCKRSAALVHPLYAPMQRGQEGFWDRRNTVRPLRVLVWPPCRCLIPIRSCLQSAFMCFTWFCSQNGPLLPADWNHHCTSHIALCSCRPCSVFSGAGFTQAFVANSQVT